MSEQPDVKVIAAALAAPFDASEVRWRAGATTKDKSRAQALAYITARAVMDRLDQVVGPDGWEAAFETVPGGAVCHLRVRLGAVWVVKHDVGAPTAGSEERNKIKAAYSDALKRAAVHFGIGRYLYRLECPWVDYDGHNLKKAPTLPPWALPATKKVEQPKKSGNGKPLEKPPEPFDARMDPAELIDRQLWEYLRWLAASKGISDRQVKDRFGVKKLLELTVAQYREAVAKLKTYSDMVSL